MSVLWIAALALTLTTLVLVLVPLLRHRGGAAPARTDFDMVVYRDQLAEVDRDLERGLLDTEQAEAARIEVKRRMLAVTGEQAPVPSVSPPPQRSFPLFVVVSVLVPAGAFAFYLALGTPDAPDRPLVARQGSGEPAQSPSGVPGSGQMPMEDAIARLSERLEADPQNLQGWLMLGRSYLTLKQYPEAVQAYRRAFRLGAGRADVASAYGEALVAAAGGEVTFDAQEAFRSALTKDPVDPSARYYLALHLAQEGDLKGAVQGWVDLVAVSPPGSPWVPVVSQQIARGAQELGIDPQGLEPTEEARALAEGAAFPAPNRADMEAAAQMSEQERETMIRSMVEQLASRLEDNPDDLAGWQRLARAYEVLGDAEKAKGARARAEALKNR